MFPVTVRIYDIQFSQIVSKFFDMSLLEGVSASTVDSMFNSTDDLFSKHNISWDYCMAIGLDNTNANIGEHNSIKSSAWEKNDNTVVAGCPCHIIHTATSKAGDAFHKIIACDISSHCVDLCYWFEKSSKQNGTLKENTSSVI